MSIDRLTACYLWDGIPYNKFREDKQGIFAVLLDLHLFF